MPPLIYIDSHTAGEPTRVVIEGGPELGTGPMAERRSLLARDHDWLRQALILEPRGYAWLVGALLQPPVEPDCTAGVIFFNNAGYLGMCGHGLIGVVQTLAFLGRIGPGQHRFETPAGTVQAVLAEDGLVAIDNVASYRFQKDVRLEVPGEGPVVGDIAYGGNWFFLVAGEDVVPSDMDRLLIRSRRIRAALDREQIRGAAESVIDHIELFGPPSSSDKADSRSYVLCPGGEYDRSPCGTGTSAKLACLAAEGRLDEGQTWRQESIIGSVFEGSFRKTDEGIIPTIKGRAYVTGRTECVLDSSDPFRNGIDLAQLD